ncbi:MAG: UvrD-helicase domain-containing protein [Hyphomicrobiales bacterium]|nr:UvrD-helicase domain-containing protein [Hyphomicrobiales bacterium]
MSDASVASALRTRARLVVIEAPAGCGKTFQGSGYAADARTSVGDGRVLVLTHTHAACDVFATRSGGGRRVEIRTIDSLIAQVASAYHLGLGLPRDAAAWARKNDGYDQLAAKVAVLLNKSPMVAHAIAERYPILICDEHQDCNEHQHAVALALMDAGASLRVFADPMQSIYNSGRKTAEAAAHRWLDLKSKADIFEELDTPHRWDGAAKPLGEWILEARERLRDGKQVDLRGRLPSGLSVIVAENGARRFDGYQVAQDARRPIDAVTRQPKPLLILAAHNATVRALRGFFNRGLPIWEGHTRDALTKLTTGVQSAIGDPPAIASLLTRFLQEIGVGFTASAYADTFKSEVAAGCSASRRGKPATLQALARVIVEQPNHHGAAAMLARVRELIDTDPAFAAIKIDHRREFNNAIRLGEFKDCEEAVTEIGRRRTYSRPVPPERCISTIHKAKGLECANVMVMPCDARHFPNNLSSRCLLYVAMSRAMQSLMLVVSRTSPSPLLIL